MLQFWVSAATAAASTAATNSESSLAAMSVFSKGLFTALLGLVGVFLVLTLFFFSIKLIQRTDKTPSQTKE